MLQWLSLAAGGGWCRSEGCAEGDCRGADGVLAEGQDPVLASCYDEMPVEPPSADRSRGQDLEVRGSLILGF